MTISFTRIARREIRFPLNVTGMNPFVINFPQAGGVSGGGGGAVILEAAEAGDISLFAPAPQKGLVLTGDWGVRVTGDLDSGGLLTVRFGIFTEEGVELFQLSGTVDLATDGDQTIFPSPTVLTSRWDNQSGLPTYFGLVVIVPADTPVVGQLQVWGKFAAGEVIIIEDP